MINRLENAARQALEALEYVLKPTADFDEAVCQKLHDTSIAALREALAEQQAAESNAVLVEGFSQVALGKLNALQSKGYAINGVSIATISEAGETNRGAVTTGGMVLWWPQQPAEQAAEPVTLETVYETIIKWDEGGGKRSRRELARRIVAIYAAPTQQPLTEEQIGEIGRNHEKFDKAGNEWFDRWVFARAIEAAHGITSKKGGAA